MSLVMEAVLVADSWSVQVIRPELCLPGWPAVRWQRWENPNREAHSVIGVPLESRADAFVEAVVRVETITHAPPGVGMLRRQVVAGFAQMTHRRLLGLVNSSSPTTVRWVP